MANSYKQLKGKEMDVPDRNRMPQIQCLEGHSWGELKGKIDLGGHFWPEEGVSLPGVSGADLQAKSVHLGPFVNVVLTRVAKTILESPCFLGEGPDQAFSGGKCLRLAAENGGFKGEGGINPLPPRGLKGIHNVGKDKSNQGIEMHQQRVANVAAKDVEG